ncbi:hypothetical protein UVIVOLLU_CDS0048 [Salmonella phage PHA46_2]
MIQYRFDDKNNPAEAGFLLCMKIKVSMLHNFHLVFLASNLNTPSEPNTTAKRRR